MTLPFSKCHALGADYIVIDNRERNLDDIFKDTSYLAGLCNRNYGIGAGGIVEITLCDHPDTKYQVSTLHCVTTQTLSTR